jgi:hypothetical protein
MIIAVAALLAIAVLVLILGVREKDLPEPEPVSPFQHLDERKAAIYENLRDLQFEYRLGKMSDADYQATKADLQKELAAVLADVDRLKAELLKSGTVPAPKQKAAVAAAPKQPERIKCASCGAEFSERLKFCGECGRPLEVTA